MLALICPALVLLAMAGCGGGPPSSIHVIVASVSAQPRLQPGNTAQIVFSPSTDGFNGTLALSSISITFTDPSGNAQSATPTAQTNTGQNYTLTFTVPAFAPTAATSYQVTLQGATSQNQTFSSLEPISATVYPAATISSLVPASSNQGRSVTVAITGVNTDFAQGQTQAVFGAGVAVNGAANGLPGLISVTSATTATASLVIDPAATIATRDVSVTTQGQTAILKAGFNVQAALLPLVASAGGPYTGFTGRSVQFDGSKSNDPNGLVLTYSWNFGDGTTGTGVQPIHTYTKAGAFTVQLTLTDSAGLSTTASTTATITTLVNPTAVAGGPYTGTTGTAIAFDGSASTDPNSSALTYAWTFGDGSNSTGAKPSHTYATAGTFTATLTVTDTYNLTGSAMATVTVTNPIQPPVAQAGGPYTGTAGTALTFNGSGSTDPQNQTLTYAWDFGDGTTGSGARPTHAYANAGTYTAALTVTDTEGLTSTANATVTIAAAPKPPAAVAGGPYTGVAGTAVSFNGSASSDPQSQTLTYAWAFGDGSNSTGATPSHTYTNAGAYTATLTVTDTSNLTNSATASVTISASPKPPTAVAGGPYTGVTGTAVSFNGSASSDPQSQTLTYAWTFGDGSTGTGATPTHAYATAGTYTATLTVTDTSNLTNSATATVTIAAAGVLTANPGGPYAGNVGAAVTFNGTASSDPKNETLTYAWAFGDGSTGTGASPTHTYTDAQVYTVTLTVTNTDGATASATTTATIANVLTAIQTGPYSGNVGQSIAFNGVTSTAPGSDSLTYSWSFGDGGTATGSEVNHTYTTAGTFPVVLTVTDTTTNHTNSSTSSATITAPPALTFTSPTQGALFNTTSIQVAGTAATSVQSVLVNGVTATLSGGTFTATVPVRAGVNILTATGTDNAGNVGTASTSVTVDLVPPTISLLQPTSGSTVTTQQISVSGMVTDQVTGTVNSNNVAVTVNGQPATVSNRSFMVSNLLLVPGANNLTLVATDAAGNTSTSIAQVNYVNPSAQQHIVVLSGDAQSGTISSVLPQPLVVQLVSPTGTPIPNRAVTFTVTASDGTVESLPLQAQTLNLTTDAQGKASVLFQLGSRAGLGINQVAVTSPGFMGGTVFSETTTAGPAAYIHEFMGDNQRGIIGQPLAQAFQTIVQDSGGDPIANVPVTFTVNTGDGLFAGQTTITVNTNSDGRALATLTLGQQEGINNNKVSADFPNDTNTAVNFYASGFSLGAAANTSVSGIVLDAAQNPVPNATVSLLNTALLTTSDANGHFVLNGAPVGTVTMLVDGSTTSLSETLPSLSFILQALPGQNNTINMPVYLPIIDTSSAKTAGGSVPATLTLAAMPGVALTVAPNSVTFPDGSHVGQLTLSQVKSDLIPMPPPNGIAPGFAWTIQPAGTIFSTPVTITIPNTTGLAPGQVQEFYQYDHDLEQFVSVGTLRVSPDGSVLNSDPGFGITKAGWASPGNSPPPGGCGQSCDDNNACTTDSQNNNTCVCSHTPNKQKGACFTNPPPGPNTCQNPGMCDPATGACKNTKKPFLSGCDDGLYCTFKDSCTYDGVCRGTMIPPKIVPYQGAAAMTNINTVLNGIMKMFGSTLGPTASSFMPYVTYQGQQNDICCEALQGKMVPNANVEFDAGGQISSPQIYLDFPPYSLPFGLNEGGYGLSAQVSAQLQGALTADFNECNQNSQQQVTLGGNIMLSATVTIGIGATLNYPNGAPLAGLQVVAPLGLNATFGPAPGLGQFSGTIGSTTLQLQFQEIIGGVTTVFPLWNFPTAKTFYEGTFSIPLPNP